MTTTTTTSTGLFNFKQVALAIRGFGIRSFNYSRPYETADNEAKLLF